MTEKTSKNAKRKARTALKQAATGEEGAHSPESRSVITPVNNSSEAGGQHHENGAQEKQDDGKDSTTVAGEQTTVVDAHEALDTDHFERVELYGLEKAPSLNGKTGVLLGRAPAAVAEAETVTAPQDVRWMVKLDGDDHCKKVKLVNIRGAEDCSFRVCGIPSKGKGCVALRLIKAGEIIVKEKPLLRVSGSLEQVDALFAGLSERARAHIHALSVSPKYSCFGHAVGVFSTNAIPTGRGEDVLCPVVARFNHECSFNAVYAFREREDREAVIATRDIQAGEEICLTYLRTTDLLLPVAQRSEKLQERCGFSLATGEGAADGDQKRLLVSKALDTFNENCRSMQVGKATGDLARETTKLVVWILRQHRDSCNVGPTCVGDLAYDAARLLIMGGAEKAQIFKAEDDFVQSFLQREAAEEPKASAELPAEHAVFRTLARIAHDSFLIMRGAENGLVKTLHTWAFSARLPSKKEAKERQFLDE